MSKNKSTINIGSHNKKDSSKNINNQYKLEKTTVGNDNNIVYGENQNIVKYKGFTKDVSFTSKLSPYVIKKIGKKNVKIAGLISFFASFITIYLWASSIRFNEHFLYTRFCCSAFKFDCLLWFNSFRCFYLMH